MGSSAECVKDRTEAGAWGPLSGALRVVFRLTSGAVQSVAPKVVRTLTGGARLDAPKAVHWLTRGGSTVGCSGGANRKGSQVSGLMNRPFKIRAEASF